MKRRPFHDGQKVPLDRFYIERDQDAEYVDGLRRGVDAPDVGPHLCGTRQSGKSSLVLRAKSQLASTHVVLGADLAGALSGRGKRSGPAEFWDGFGEGLIFSLKSERPDDPDMIAAFSAAVAKGQFSQALITLARTLDALGKPLILILDELDSIGIDRREELCLMLSAVLEDRANSPTSRFNVSLVGVHPPVTRDDSPAERKPIQHIGGYALWLEDFPVSLPMENEVRRAFAEADPAIALPEPAAHAILEYVGGYPRALAWLGNQVAEAHSDGAIVLDELSVQQLREVAVAHLPHADAQTPDERHARILDTEWMKNVSDYFLGYVTSADSAYRQEPATPAPVPDEDSRLAIMVRAEEVRSALEQYGALLTAHAAAAVPAAYNTKSPAHQLLRFSGVARRDSSGLRVRSQFFADVFNEQWRADTERLVYSVQRSTWVRRPRRPSKSPYRSDKRLLILGTGGTVGMALDPRGHIRPEADHEPEWLMEAEEILGRAPTFVPILKPPLDSADIGPNQWEALSRRILLAQRDYDGIVVAHGTDTMAYTASAVAFALGKDLSFPVVFTGSQTTADVLHGDAVSNILRAALVATQDLPEVVVCFGEKIFRATRTQKKDDLRFDAFESPGYAELGFVAEEVQVFRQSLLQKSGAPTGPLPLSRPTEFSSGILHVSQMPGSEAAFYEAALGVLEKESPTDIPNATRDARASELRSLCKGIIIQSLGAGNIPTKSAPFDLRHLIETAKERSIPVVLTSQYPVLPANYQRFDPSDAAIKAGAIPTGNMTISAVVAKLSWVLPQVEAEIAKGLAAGDRLERVREMMTEELVGEGGLTMPKDTSLERNERLSADNYTRDAEGSSGHAANSRRTTD